LSAYFILWILLFEFILPVNKILPKPSIVLQSFDDLWNVYNLPLNYISTITVIYLSISLAFLFLRILSPLILKSNFISNFILSLEWFSRYLPGIITGMLLIFWFPDSEYIEFIFAFLAILFSLIIKFQKELKNVEKEYINSLLSLGAGESFIFSNVVWKSIQPSLLKHILTIHFYLWILIIAFEYIKGGYGVGSIYRTALEFKDLSAFFSISLITGITIFLGHFLIEFLKNKFFFWSYN
jgi:NitT/TauT family transport system permease protein